MLHRIQNSETPPIGSKVLNKYSHMNNVSEFSQYSPSSNVGYVKESKMMNQNEKFKTIVDKRTFDLRNAKNITQKDTNMHYGFDKQYIESKPFQKGGRRAQARSQQKDLGNGHFKNVHDLPSIEKTKTVSNNFRSKINKNIIKDSMTEKAKEEMVPNSHQSFRIKIQMNGKKLSQELRKLNQEQSLLQNQLMNLHSRTKSQLFSTLSKYSIKAYNVNNLQINQQRSDVTSTPKNRKSELTTLSPDGSAKNQRIQQLQRFQRSPQSQRLNDFQINDKQNFKQFQRYSEFPHLSSLMKSINKQLHETKMRIQNEQKQIQNNALNICINSVYDIFQERQSEEEHEQVPEIKKQRKIVDPGKTYQTVMSEMKKKKWSVLQRFNYNDNAKMAESRSVQKVSQKQTIEQQNENQESKVEDHENETKIVVNQRLKNFLLE